MTNREKYKLNSGMVLENINGNNEWYCRFAPKHILKRDNCGVVNCNDCKATFVLWLDEDAEEGAVDWSKVEKGTLIEVSDKPDDCDFWYKRYFIVEYNGGLVVGDKFGVISYWKNGRLLKDGDKHD